MRARYLIRIDDLCPAMNWAVWEQVESVLAAAGVSPLLAVVPDNQDPELNFGPAAADFWDRVRGWQARGWSIGLHGHTHQYTTRESGLLGRNRYSEFAGVPAETQRRKLAEALAIFRREGVRPEAWIAPAHSFDRNTVDLLAEFGIPAISDGYALGPYRGRHGLLWVPQQLGRFRPMPFGLWTVCLHINRWTQREIEALRADIARYPIVSFADAQARYAERRASLPDHLFFACFRALRSLRA